MKTMIRSLLVMITIIAISTQSTAQWVQTNGPYSGDIQCLALSGTNLFAGISTSLNGETSYGCGVYLSTNNGTSWTQTGLANTSVSALVVSPVSGGIGQRIDSLSSTNLFAGTGEPFNLGEIIGQGVFLSTNNGTSWSAVNLGLTDPSVYALVVSPNESGGMNLFAGTASGGVFVSTNNGTTWNTTGLTDICVFALVVSHNEAGGTNLFAGTDEGVFLSTNNGKSWAAVNTGLTDGFVISLAVSPASGGTGSTNLFAGTYGGGVFLSTNNGTTWNTTGLTNTYVRTLAVSDSNIFAGTDHGEVFRSTNNGASWTPVKIGLRNTVVTAFAFNGTNLFSGTNGAGVFLSTDNGTSWNSASTGLRNTCVYTLVVSPASDGTGSTNLFAGTDYGVFLSTNNGTTWNITGLTNTFVRTLVVCGEYLFAVADGVFRSSNNGASWTPANTGLTNTSILALAVSGNNIFAGTIGGGVFLSTNNGTTWNTAGLTNNCVTAIAISGANLFAGTSHYSGNAGVFLSTNKGTSWSATSLTNTYVEAFAVSSNATGGTNLFAGTDDGTYLSTNNGTSWSAVNTGLRGHPVMSFTVSGTNLFAGTYSGGVCLSTNNGTSWTSVNTGLTGNFVLTLAISPNGANQGLDSPSGMNLFAGNYDGVWRRPLSEMIATSVKQTSTPLPERFELEQNYPNPFNPSTTIEYNIPQESQATVKIFDLLGREVAVLVNERKDAGRYSMQWNGEQFASGIYFYALQAGEFHETKRMSLIK